MGRLAAFFLLLLVPHCLAQQPLIADSQSDFSGTQGKAGWSYLFFISNKDGTDLYVPDDARPMNWSPGKGGRQAAWSGPGQWYVQSDAGAEPQAINGSFQGWTVRRWTSDRTATLHITGHASRDSKEGDGVIIKVFVDGKELVSKPVAPASTVDLDLTTPVIKGSRIDFMSPRAPASTPPSIPQGFASLFLPPPDNEVEQIKNYRSLWSLRYKWLPGSAFPTMG